MVIYEFAWITKTQDAESNEMSYKFGLHFKNLWPVWVLGDTEDIW